MDMKLKRLSFQDDGIFSELTDMDGNVIAYTLEHSYDCKPKVQNGVYTCVRGMHQLHTGPAFYTFEVTGVEGHSGILFHVGNWNKDSDGCILVGEAKASSSQGDMVTSSTVAFKHFLDIQSDVDSFTLTVS